MKLIKSFALWFLLFLILAGGMAYFFWPNYNKIEIESFENDTELSELDEQIFEYKEGEALLYRETDDVFFMFPGRAEAKLLIREIYVPSGTRIRTGDGVAIVVFPDNSIMTVDENTEVELSFDENGISVFQAIGDTWHRAASFLSDNSSYKVDTPTALATVRGTIFAVKVYADGLFDLWVFESVVDVFEHQDEGTLPVFVSAVDAGEGFFSKVGRLSGPMVRKLSSEDSASFWHEKNFAFDEKWTAFFTTELSPHEFLYKILHSELQRERGAEPFTNLRRDPGASRVSEDDLDESAVEEFSGEPLAEEGADDLLIEQDGEENSFAVLGASSQNDTGEFFGDVVLTEEVVDGGGEENEYPEREYTGENETDTGDSDYPLQEEEEGFVEPLFTEPEILTTPLLLAEPLIYEPVFPETTFVFSPLYFEPVDSTQDSSTGNDTTLY